MDKNLENKNECKEFMIFTEDFCFKFSDCNDNQKCGGCSGFADLFKWLTDKSSEKQSFF